MNKFLTSLILVLICANSSASKFYDERAKRNKEQIDQFLADGRELREREYFLFHLRTEIFPSDLDRLGQLFEMDVETIFICTETSVLARGLDHTQSIAAFVNKIDIREALGSGSGREVNNEVLGPELAANDLRLCGFNARLSNRLLTKFLSTSGVDVFSVELRDGRRLLVPVNPRRDPIK